MSVVSALRPRPAIWPAAVALALALASPGCGKSSRSAPAPAAGRPRPAGFVRYDEPRESVEFYARKRAPVGQRAIPAERYRAARERIGQMPVYSTRTGTVARPGGRGRGEVGAATTGGPDIGTWSALGPGNIGGRTRAIVIQPPPNESTMYAAAVAGGVWKTTDSGTTWAPTDDHMANLAVTTLAMDPNASNTLLAGTGEGYFNGDAVRGAGIFKTTDGGLTWTPIDKPGTGLDQTCEFHYINKIVYSQQHANTAYAAVGYSASCDGSNQGGVYRTTNGGGTWTRILATTVFGGCLDLAIRNDLANDTLFASCGTFAAAQVFRNDSAYATSSFTNITTAISPTLKPYMGRTSLAIAPSNQSTIYAIAADNSLDDFLGLWRSLDGGFTWTERSSYLDPSPTLRLFTNLPYADGCFTKSGTYNQGWYDNVIAVDPSDEQVVWVGGIDLFRSDDAGTSFGLASFWWSPSASSYAHADQHALVFDSGGSLFVGNDGGLFRTDNPNAALASSSTRCNPAGSSVSFVNLNHGYAVTQFYYGAVLPDDTEYFGGAQDNGTLRGSPASTSWSQMLGGDGGAVAVDPINPLNFYGEYTRGQIQKSTDGGANWNDAVAGINDTGFEFIAPLLMDPSAPNDAAAAARLWTGGNNLWRTTNGAGVWVKASTLLASSTTALAVAPSNPNFVLAGTRTGAIHRNTAAVSAGGSTPWPSKAPRTGYVSSVAFDPWDANVAYATYSTFGGTHVWKSTDAGANWSGLDGTGIKIPDLPVHTIVVDPTSSSRLYVGTDLGVFVTTDGGANWDAENTGFGNVVTEHLVINGANLYAFTHGRGVWRVPLTNATQTALLEFASPKSSVTEGPAATANVSVRLRTSNNLPLASAVSVAYATADGTAIQGSDYTQTVGTLTFAAGFIDGNAQTISIPIVNDSVGEPKQTFTLNLSSPSSGSILARRIHTITIIDDGDPPGISINDITMTEGNSGNTSAVFTVSLTGPAPPGGATVKYQTADGSGVAGVDYLSVGVPTPFTLSFPAGAMSTTLSVPVIGNTLPGPTRTFVVNLSSPMHASIDDSQGQATILDNDLSGTIELSAAAYSVKENAGQATIMLKRTGGVASGVSVQVQAVAGTATGGGVDFGAPAGSVTFAAGATTASFTVPITNDSIAEPAETVLLRIFGPGGLGATLGAQQTAILTINDDDLPGQVKFAAAAYAVTEGAAGGVDLKVARSGGAASGVTVGYTITGTATGTDYALAPASLTFGAGEMLKTIHVDAVADGLPEGNETVVVTLNPPGGGATLGTPSSTVLTITDLEPTFAFTASQVTVAETARTVVATVRRTGTLTSAATVSFATTDGSATGGTGTNDDFVPTSGTLTFAPHVATRTITVTLRPDSDFEPLQAFTVDLSNPSVGMSLGSPSSLTVSIPNDDFGGTFSFAAPTYTVLESKPSVMLTVKRTGGLANADVTYQTGIGTATPGVDFAGTAGSLLHFAAGKTSATITIPIVQDALGEGNETFPVILSGPTAGGSLGSPSTAIITIQDDDRVVSFGAATYTVKEPSSGTVNLLIPVKRTGPAGAFAVSYSVAGSATGLDFTSSPASPLTFQATDMVKNLTLTVSHDALLEGNETVVLTLSAPTNNTGLGALPTTTVNITDQQPVISLGAAAYTVTEPVGNAPSQALITVKRTGNLQNGSSFAYTVNPGSAIAGSDYDPAGATPPSPVTFLAGQSQVQIKVPVLPDTEAEPAETFTVTLSSPAAASLGSLVTTTVTIKDNDTAGKIQIANSQYAVSEDAGSAVIKLTRTLGAAGNASVICRTADGSATAGSDYTATAQTVTFAAGQTSATCTIPITDDSTPGEGAETVLVSIDTPSYGVTIGTPNTAIVYLLDND